MPGRNATPGNYRYGFQGQEKDDEIKGGGSHVNFTYRGYDPRIGRMWSIDLLSAKYPYWTPYAFSGNRIIDSKEFEGLEPIAAADARTFFFDQFGASAGDFIDDPNGNIYRVVSVEEVSRSVYRTSVPALPLNTFNQRLANAPVRIISVPPQRDYKVRGTLPGIDPNIEGTTNPTPSQPFIKNPNARITTQGNALAYTEVDIEKRTRQRVVLNPIQLPTTLNAAFQSNSPNFTPGTQARANRQLNEIGQLLVQNPASSVTITINTNLAAGTMLPAGGNVANLMNQRQTAITDVLDAIPGIDPSQVNVVQQFNQPAGTAVNFNFNFPTVNENPTGNVNEVDPVAGAAPTGW